MVSLAKGMKGVLRMGQTLSVLGRTGVDWARGERPPAPRLLRQTFERLGATYIKLGQFIASSPTFFPPEYVEEFQSCLDHTPSLPFSEIRDIIESELGRPVDQVYAEIDPVALASASIAQVHAARLVTGEDVVIKVQKPGVETILQADLGFLQIASRVVETLAPRLSWTSLSAVVDEIRSTMLEECDFNREADNLRVFRQFLQDHGIDQATVPQVYSDFSRRRVLTMERFHGVSLTDPVKLQHITADPETALITAMNTWFASLTGCEFFHADVHAGNLMVLDDGRVGFIDFGIVGRIRPETWTAIRDFVSAIMAGSFDGMADAMVRVGITRDQVDAPALAKDLKELYGRMDTMGTADSSEPGENAARQAEDQVNNLLMEIVRTGERHGLHFPREFALLLKQFLYFDRYVHVLAPEMDMFMDERLNLLS